MTLLSARLPKHYQPPMQHLEDFHLRPSGRVEEACGRQEQPQRDWRNQK